MIMLLGNLAHRFVYIAVVVDRFGNFLNYIVSYDTLDSVVSDVIDYISRYDYSETDVNYEVEFGRWSDALNRYIPIGSLDYFLSDVR